MNREKSYILGTDPEELERLGFQHRVWSAELFSFLRTCGVSQGHHVLDIGCGPGFCSFDIAQIVGAQGQVVGIDMSESYIAYAMDQAHQRFQPQLHFIHGAFDSADPGPAPFDFIFSRWALAWVEDPGAVIARMTRYLNTGGLFMCQEYLNWGTFSITPQLPAVTRLIEACRESWQMMNGMIDVGSNLAELFERNGLEVVHIKPLAKISGPKELTWHWPGTFLRIYSLKLIEMGLITSGERDAFLEAWVWLSTRNSSLFYAPLMMEIAAKKK